MSLMIRPRSQHKNGKNIKGKNVSQDNQIKNQNKNENMGDQSQSMDKQES